MDSACPAPLDNRPLTFDEFLGAGSARRSIPAPRPVPTRTSRQSKSSNRSSARPASSTRRLMCARSRDKSTTCCKRDRLARAPPSARACHDSDSAHVGRIGWLSERAGHPRAISACRGRHAGTGGNPARLALGAFMMWWVGINLLRERAGLARSVAGGGAGRRQSWLPAQRTGADSNHWPGSAAS